MTDTLDSTGLTIDDFDTRLASVKTELRAQISPTLDLSSDQPDGQFVEILVERIQAALEIVQEVYTAYDPDQASGVSLTALAALTGTIRRDATYGTVTLSVELNAATTLPAGSIAHVAGDSTNRWSTNADVTSTTQGWYDAEATCTVAGAVQALAGTITEISTPVTGWTDVTNASDASEGLAEETDTALRLRREIEISQGGSTSVDSIQADLSALTGVLTAKVYENDTDQYDGTRPPHSFEAVIHKSTATNAQIAEAIFESKPAGIQAYGTTVVVHTDEQEVDHSIGFTEVTSLDIYLEFTLSTDPDTYEGDQEFKVAIAAFGDSTYGPGDDVILSKLVAEAFGVEGVLDVELIRVKKDAGGSWQTTNYAVDYDELADLSTTRITIL